MFCPSCGNQIPDGSTVCPACGSNLGAGTPMLPEGGAQGAGASGGSGSYGTPGYQAGYGTQQGYGSQQAYGAQSGYGAQAGYRAQGTTGQGFGAADGYSGYAAPAAPLGSRKVNDSRSFPLFVLITFLTCGIYRYIALHEMAEDMNAICRGDEDETPGIVVFIILSWLTAGLYSAWWIYRLGNRLQRNAPRYGLSFKQNGTTLLIWSYAGCLLCCIGPFVADYILIKNTNALGAAYNAQLGCM